MSNERQLGSSSKSVIGDFVNRQQSSPEQLGVGSAEHRTLQGFEPVDLAFSLPIAPTFDHRHGVWLYHVFSLSFRDVELILAERDVIVSYESIRRWCLKFGASFVADRPYVGHQGLRKALSN